MNVTFRVNGNPVTVDVPADMPLLWVLRDVLELKGAKYGCGIAQCGACTVHRDGNPVRSCITPAGTLEGADIVTIEGLSPDGTHPVQRAWEEIDVAQCGYCQAGQIMSAAALLTRNPRPSDEDIDGAMNGNLCRCATYLRIRQAIHRAAALPTLDGAEATPGQPPGPAGAAAPERTGAAPARAAASAAPARYPQEAP